MCTGKEKGGPSLAGERNERTENRGRKREGGGTREIPMQEGKKGILLSRALKTRGNHFV